MILIYEFFRREEFYQNFVMKLRNSKELFEILAKCIITFDQKHFSGKAPKEEIYINLKKNSIESVLLQIECNRKFRESLDKKWSIILCLNLFVHETLRNKKKLSSTIISFWK